MVPGFSTSDSGPMSIEHVAPLTATTVTLFSSLRHDDLIPRDIGVEILPWLSVSGGDPAKVLERYRRLYTPGVKAGMLQYAGFSLAISQAIPALDPSQPPVSRVSIGARTFVLNGRPNQALQNAMDDFDKRAKALTAAAQKREAALQQPDEAQRSAAAKELQDRFEETRVALTRLAATDKSRLGVLVEAGSAVTYEVVERRLKNARAERTAGWVSPMYRWPTVDVSGLVRYIDEDSTDYRIWDSGGRVSYRRAGTQFSFEMIGRKVLPAVHVAGADYAHLRAMFGVEYGFSRSTQLTLTMGKNYGRGFSRSGTMEASIGLTIGLGEVAPIAP